MNSFIPFILQNVYKYFLAELDASFADSDANDMGHPMVYMLPDDHSGFHNTHTFVGRHRTAYVAVHSDGKYTAKLL